MEPPAGRAAGGTDARVSRETRLMLTQITPEQRVPSDRPLRKIKEMAELELDRLSLLLDRMYVRIGPPIDSS
jgi:hypothetical protein